MITEEQYLAAKKIIAQYKKQRLNKPDVIVSKLNTKSKTKNKGESFFKSWDKLIKDINL